MEMMDQVPRATVERAVAIVPARDMARSVAFYEDLGFVARLHQDGGYAFVSRDQVEIHLREAAGDLSSGQSAGGVYLYVSDADEVYEEWLAAGVTILQAPEDKEWRMREFALSDPDGLLLRVGHRLPG